MQDIKMFRYNKMSSKKINSFVKKLMKKNIEVQDRMDNIDYYDIGNKLTNFRTLRTLRETLIS